MILLKGFFRKKTSKVYLFIFIILIIPMMLLLSFEKYFEDILRNLFQENTYVLLITEDDYFDVLQEDNNISNIQPVVLFKQSKLYFNDILNWDNLTDCMNEYVITTYDESLSENLSDGEIIIRLNSLILNENKEIYTLKSENFNFINNNKELEFTIKEIYKSNFTRVILTKKEFQNLYNDETSFAYVFNVNSIEKYKSLEKKYKKASNYIEINLIQQYELDDDYTAIHMDDLITVLKHIIYILIIFFTLLFTFVVVNIIKDEEKLTFIEKQIGYNKFQITKSIFLKISSLVLVTLTISIISSLLITLLIANIMKIPLFLNLIPMILICLLLLLITLFVCINAVSKR